MLILTHNLEQLLRLADEAYQKSDWPQAIKYLRKVTHRYKKSAPPEAWLQLTLCYVNEKNLGKAEAAAAEGIKLYPKLTKLVALAGKAASANGDWSLAETYWSRVLEVSEEKAPPVAWAYLAKAQRLLGNTAQAEKTAKTGLKKHAGNLEIVIELAEQATAKKEWRTAHKHWKTALRIINAQAKPNFTTRQQVRFNISIVKRLSTITSYKKAIKKYATYTGKRRFAVVTSMTRGYDSLKPPEVLDDRFDYIVYTDDKLDGMGIFDIRPLPKPELDDARAIRYVKTHPHTLLADYDAVIWMDTSLMIVGDIYPLIKKFLDSGLPIGSGVHPLRKNIYEEFEANVRLNKENQKVMKKQIDYYRSQGFTHNDLTENTLLMFNPKHKKTAPALELWWEQITKFSRRDQLSFNYSLSKTGAQWFKLTKSPHNIRNHPNFVITPHHTSPQVLAELVSALH